MQAALVCRTMGWTWDEYQDQPVEFLATVLAMIKEEAAAQKTAAAQ